MNITEVARRVKLSPNQLKEILPELGFDIGKRAIQIDDRTAHRIVSQLNNDSVRNKFLNKISSDGQPLINENEVKENVVKKDARTIEISETIVVKKLAQLMKIPVTKLILELMKNGVMASLNQEIDFETASIIAEDLGFKVNKLNNTEINLKKETQKIEKYLEDKKENLSSRPPVITIMGHVDHGKTKLLDAIRETNVVDSEAGGITQHIGAYQVEKNNQILTFIDTPGHEAFSAMRSRGAQIADIVILVIAVDDGIQPQTIESISHIRSAKLPFIIALNKIDSPNANVDKIKSALAELDLTPEDWGGKTICVEISAKQRTNIDKLLETLILIYEIEKENIVANSKRNAIGTIIESHLDKGEGPVATVLIQTGTLHKNDFVKIGDCLGKIKIMKDWRGQNSETAPPSTPIKIIGLKSVPEVGEILEVVDDIKNYKRKIKKIKNTKSVQTKPSISLQKNSDDTQEKEIKKINIILKTDVLGSQEAMLELIEPLQRPDLIVNIVSCGLGNITEVDVERAEKLNAHLLGFNVQVNSQSELLARDKKVIIKISKIIYELLDFLKEKMNEQIEVEIVREVIGKMKVLKIFRTEKKSQILGGKIIEGKIIKNAKLNIYRNDEFLSPATLTELQSGKQDVNEVLEGQEAGIKIEDFNEVQEGDIIEIIKEEKIERKI